MSVRVRFPSGARKPLLEEIPGGVFVLGSRMAQTITIFGLSRKSMCLSIDLSESEQEVFNI